MDHFLHLALGLATGVLSGTLGIGGGILLIPALMWFGWVPDQDQRHASGITLAVLAMPVVLPAVWRYYHHEWLTGPELIIAVWIAAGFFVGGWIGAEYVLPHIPVGTLRLLFGLALILVAVRFLMASNSEVDAALAGLLGVSGAWIGWFLLRALGRRYLPKPSLAVKIQENYRPPDEFSEYQI